MQATLRLLGAFLNLRADFENAAQASGRSLPPLKPLLQAKDASEISTALRDPNVIRVLQRNADVLGEREPQFWQTLTETGPEEVGTALGTKRASSTSSTTSAAPSLVRDVVKHAVGGGAGAAVGSAGIGTILATVTKDANASKGLLRHSSLTTTMEHYILDVPEVTLHGMEQVEQLFAPVAAPASNSEQQHAANVQQREQEEDAEKSPVVAQSTRTQ